MDRQIHLLISHIPGKCNVEADKASRTHNFCVEWALNDDKFLRILKEFGPFDVDLFASRLNFKVQKYVSWKPDPGAFFIDAFHCQWNFKLAYCFPPFSVIPSVLQKVEEDKAEIVIVVPFWPTALWFSKLFSLMVASPCFLRHSQKLLYHPMNLDIPHPMFKHLNLIVCRLSGKHYKHRDFLQTLQRSSFQHGDQQPENNITLTSRNGIHFAKKGVFIPFQEM